ncbi:zinc finger BED domain-containing protein RICESLEEPER 2 [Tanacetum coccineum]
MMGPRPRLRRRLRLRLQFGRRVRVGTNGVEIGIVGNGLKFGIVGRLEAHWELLDVGVVGLDEDDFVTHLHSKEFATFDVLGFWKEKETMFPTLSRMAMDIISVQASSVASESTFSTSGRVLSIRRTRLTLVSLEMCMCLKDHLDAKERKQDKCHLEIPLDFEEDVFDDEVQRNEAIPLSDEEIALDASNEDTLSPGGPRYNYMMNNEAEDEKMSTNFRLVCCIFNSLALCC